MPFLNEYKMPYPSAEALLFKGQQSSPHRQTTVVGPQGSISQDWSDIEHVTRKEAYGKTAHDRPHALPLAADFSLDFCIFNTFFTMFCSSTRKARTILCPTRRSPWGMLKPL